MNLTGKVILITGGASGIGASCVKEFLKNNAKGVVVADIINNEIDTELYKEYGAGKVTFVKADVSNRESFENAFRKTIDAYNSIDILINCAGMVNEFEFEKTIAVNLLGTVFGCDLAINKYFPQFKTEPTSYIVNIASIAGIIPSGSIPYYAASKHGIVGLTRSFGVNTTIEKEGICFMALCPGLTNTPLGSNINFGKFTPYMEVMEKEMDLCTKQEADSVSRSVVQMLQHPEHGSIWVVDNSVLFKVDLPTYKTLINLRASNEQNTLGEGNKYV